MTLYPLTFEPIFKERVWGGRTLASRYRKALPPDVPIGESWEVSDRPGDESVIANGPLAGRTLRWLMDAQRKPLLGNAAPAAGDRFPLLCKILDAREKLSLQVHPPASQSHLGDPKTEMWYIAAADPGAELYVGLKPGVTRETFEGAIRTGEVAACFHRIAVRAGDTMFLPSGRVHAIGAGLVIFEIQQNSDTTFRVFDWNRMGLDGRPRDLHVAESMASIDFADFEPPLAGEEPVRAGAFTRQALVRHALFTADIVRADAAAAEMTLGGKLRVLAIVDADVTVAGGGETVTLGAGQFCVLPASLDDVRLSAGPGAAFLVVDVP